MEGGFIAGPIGYWFRVPGSEHGTGYLPIVTDKDAIDMCKFEDLDHISFIGHYIEDIEDGPNIIDLEDDDDDPDVGFEYGHGPFSFAKEFGSTGAEEEHDGLGSDREVHVDDDAEREVGTDGPDREVGTEVPGHGPDSGVGLTGPDREVGIDGPGHGPDSGVGPTGPDRETGQTGGEARQRAHGPNARVTLKSKKRAMDKGKRPAVEEEAVNKTKKQTARAKKGCAKRYSTRSTGESSTAANRQSEEVVNSDSSTDSDDPDFEGIVDSDYEDISSDDDQQFNNNVDGDPGLAEEYEQMGFEGAISEDDLEGSDGSSNEGEDRGKFAVKCRRRYYD
ncbi:uncharacterized protein LOC133725383 [Rosa rugosa]|uniref:uncharacterized protein LOC133725383 n=1 Tax=Rosa rugosa TaxID=74645 RepID=UPI002B40F54F|nr:uncharacterized protein LOC133725383 [Rosa rugosa]